MASASNLGTGTKSAWFLTEVGKIPHAVHQTCGLGASSSVMLLHGFLWVTVFPEKAGTAQATMEITDGKEPLIRLVPFSGLRHS